MRKFSLIIVGILFPLSVHAEALSPWVQGVLDRAQMGIDFAATRSSGGCNNDTMILEIWENTDAVQAAMNKSDEIAAEMEYFRERTVCFESDRRLLQNRIRDVLDAMNTATQNCNISALRVLRSTFEFTHEAYLSFVQGAVDPSYKDDRLRRNYIFEDEEHWTTPPYPDAVYDEDSEEPLCPYTTDYAPHTIAYPGSSIGSPVTGAAGSDVKSYGCDESVLSTLPSEFTDEANALATFMRDLDAFARPLYDSVSASLQNINSIIAVLTGAKPPSSLPGSEPPPPHDEKTGCLRPSSPESSSKTTAKELEESLMAFPDYFDPENLNKDPFTGAPTYNPSDDELLPTWMLYRPTERSYIATMKNFIDKKEDMGAERPLPDIFGRTGTGDVFSFVHQILFESPMTRYIGGNTERQTGLLEASNRDPIELTQSAVEPLHRAVVNLTDVVDNFMAEEYIPSVGFFLARSCVDGHCQQTLRTVLKRIENPYCHPYISGSYTEPDAAKKCFCDPSIESKYKDFWKKYCVETLTSDEETQYRSRPGEVIPACLTDEEEAARIEEANQEREAKRKEELGEE